MRRSEEWRETQLEGFAAAILLLTALLIIGTLGFELIEGWDLLDSLYMTVITISTVGYGEIRPLSDEGIVFTIFLIVMGMSIAVYAFTVIGRAAVEGELYELRRMRKMEKKIDHMKDHMVICGYGPLARFITSELQEVSQEVVVIDYDPARLQELKEEKIPFVLGNAHEDETLEAAGIKRATALLAVLSSDADNVYVTLSARSLNPNIRIMASARDLSNESKLLRAGANQVISPYQVSGTRIVQQLLHQYVNDFLEIATSKDGQKLVVEQLVVPDTSPLVGQTLQGSQIRQKTGVSVAAIMSQTKGTNLSPGKDELIEAGDTLIVLGSNQALTKFGELVVKE